MTIIVLYNYNIAIMYYYYNFVERQDPTVNNYEDQYTINATISVSSCELEFKLSYKLLTVQIL